MCNAKNMGVPAAALIEMAFMTNAREAELMKQDNFLIETAEELVHGVCDYLGVKYIPRGEVAVKPVEPTPAPVEPAPAPSIIFPYKAKVTCNVLNVRRGPSTKNTVITTIRKNEVYTIMEEQNGWGLLKSYVSKRNGWICLDYVSKL